MEAELQRLRRLYAEMADENLMEMAEDPGNLTDDAQLALGEEMRKRGLVTEPTHSASNLSRTPPPTSASDERESGFGPGIPGVVPTGAMAVETALEPGGQVRQGMVALVAIYDGIELTKACTALEDADLEFAIEEVDGDAGSGAPPHYEIWVEIGESELGRSVLREKMGLFPLAEITDERDPHHEDGSASEDAGELVVGQFESTAEAEEVRAMLSGEGFNARVEGDPLDPSVSVVLVPAAQQPRALEVLADQLGLE